MGADRFLPQKLVDEAWRRFAAGDIDGAIEQARQAVDADPPPDMASAALSFFLIQAGRLDEAHSVLQRALARAPAFAPLHWYQGYLLQRRGDTGGAAASFLRACELDDTLDEAAYALAWTLHDLGRDEEALRWSLAALAHARTPPRLMQAGWLRQKAGLYKPAVQVYREAIRSFDASAPEQPRLHLHLSQCLVALELVDEADAALRSALDRWPLDVELLVEAAWREHKRGDWQAAFRLASELAREHPGRPEGWHLLGVLHQEVGDLKAADAAFAEVQERDPRQTDAMVRRARIQREWKQYDGARWLLELVLRESPGDAAAEDLLVQLLFDQEQTEAARRLLLRRLRAPQGTPDLRRLLAVAQWRRGRPRIAQRTLRRVVAEEPGNIEALRTQGWLALEQGDVSLAIETVKALLARMPEDSAAQVQAAFVLAHAGHIGDAQAWAERAVSHAPDSAEAWRALSQVRLRQQRYGEAESAARRALQIAPDQADCLRQLAGVLINASRPAEAQLALLRAIACKPRDPATRLELADARCRAGHFEAGLAGIDALLAERPDWHPALLLKARLMIEGGLEGAVQACAALLRADRNSRDAVKAILRLVGLGRSEARGLLPLVPIDLLRSVWPEAIVEAMYTQGAACLARMVRAACEYLDEDCGNSGAALYAASLAAESDSTGLARQARDWYRGLKIRSGLARLPAATRADGTDPRPRIAYVASQLHQSLLRRVLAAHSTDRAVVFLYTNMNCAGLPAHVNLQPLVPETLAESCRANQIDVVIDAGGLHPFAGQFAVLQAYTRRVAPVQIGWLGCWGSAGGLFDALLADDVSIPAHQEAQYEEAVLRLAGGQWCWDPPPAAPPVSPPPMLRRGDVTFGVTARSLKLGENCLDAFARIVAAVPRSTIRFIGKVAADWPLRREILARVEAHGIDSDRVFFDPFMPHADYLAWLGRIDLVLDSFPGNGGLSLLDPLWMGVPVVTLAGGWAGARQGASVLAALGLRGCVTETEMAFCNAAVALATDVAALSAHRAALRPCILGSPFVDGRRVASQIEDICARMKQGSSGIVAADGKTRTKLNARWALDAWLAPRRTIDLPIPQAGTQPDLSVIVVLFNQAGLSRRTLQALADQRGASFETIIVDNASSDRTPELLAQVRGAIVIRHEVNLGFLLAARRGATVASGRYLAFLNSDAILQRGALAAAVATLRADPGIGALGGRVVLTSGGLQEAGNVVFRDGSAGGIGRGEDPFGYAARAARSTDYVSGVFLVTPAPVWRMLGGFDEVFAPAYYEDTDYCLRAWRAGFRVVYDPSVLLEHLEWGSASGDSATVLMTRNREVFRSRHRAWLETQPRPQALPLDRDHWRSPDDRPRRARVLFLENEVPHMFKGGGLPRARLMLLALRDWPVTLFPLWEPHDDWGAVYASLPRSVEVALGHGLAGLESFLERRRGVYDVLLVSRPPNLQALQPLRARRPDLFGGMRLVYDAEALFALREIAMAGVQGRPLARAAAKVRIAAELALAEGANDVLVVSERDGRFFRAADHRTHVLSYSIAVRRSAPAATHRGGLLFVGALHPETPNEDGLLWFIREVMPLLRRAVAAAPVLSVVGVCLSRKVAALAGPDVRVLGQQDDLEPHYDAARVFVAPVRFAGGVPAKVIEAAANGIPAVVSALLVRQLEWRDGLDIVGARNALAFASAIVRLLVNDAAWQRQRDAAWEQCALRYDPEMFRRTLHRVLGGAPERAA